MDDAAQRLLEMTKTIILPEEIDHDTYHMIVEAALLYPDDEIDLYCRGQGGDSGDALGIVDIIKHHGNFTGLLLGDAASSHAIIWAGCANRYCFDNSRLGLHSVVTTFSPPYMDSRALLQSSKKSEETDRANAQILADSSKEDITYWLGLIQGANLGLNWLNAFELVTGCEIALMISDRPDLATDKKGLEIKMLDGSPIPKDDYL